MTRPLNGFSLKRYIPPDDTLNTPPRKKIRATISPSLHPSPTSTNEDLRNEGSLGCTSPPRTSELIFSPSRSIEEADNTSISPAPTANTKFKFDSMVDKDMDKDVHIHIHIHQELLDIQVNAQDQDQNHNQYQWRRGLLVAVVSLGKLRPQSLENMKSMHF